VAAPRPVASGQDRPGFRDVADAIASGDVEAARRRLREFTPEERRLLEAHIGTRAADRVFRLAAEGRPRAGPLGRVVLLPGLMGTQLDSRDAGGDSDRVWVSLPRIVLGRMGDLRLKADGGAPPPPPTVLTHGVYPPVYLPMILELHRQWHTLPLGYDWRRNIDESADMVADAIRNWGQGEPVHLIAHSMGGLVARRFVARHPGVWDSMKDPALARGGRLVMLGTPNRGSFSIAMALTGEEGTVRKLELLDQKHNSIELLRILNTFAGSYQLLPSPLLDLGDDHLRLFEHATWGALPVHQGLLDTGKAFQQDLDPVIDAPRLLFVAGHDQETPCAVTVTAPGRFQYRNTRDGDGRVPHVLGLLPGVKTYYIREKHGDLAKNETVLAAVHDLLRAGATTLMPETAPRPRLRAAAGAYPKRKEAPPAEMRPLLAAAAARPRAATLAPELAAARLEALALADFLGAPGPAPKPRAVSRTRGSSTPPGRPRAARRPAAASRRRKSPPGGRAAKASTARRKPPARPRARTKKGGRSRRR
jgi:pimeloyl-ACP methyl ester carboxylesterase